jgi:very-short-patch-repair endonuclease
MAATLTHEAASASHRSAGRLLDIEMPTVQPVEVTLPRGIRRSLRNVITYERTLPACDTTTRKGIKVTTPERTLIDVAPMMHADRLDEAIDDALRKGLTSVPRLRRMLERHAARGRDGITIMRALLMARDPAVRAYESRFERRLYIVLRDAGLPLPLCQFEVFDSGRLVARVDFAYPSKRVAIEADSWRHHSGRRAWERDVARRDRLTLLGWRILHITWNQLDRHPGLVVDKVARAIGIESL